MNDDLRKENEDVRKKGSEYWKENQRLAEWKQCLSIEEKAKAIIANAKQEEQRILSDTIQERNKILFEAADTPKNITVPHAENSAVEVEQLPATLQNNEITDMRLRLLELESKMIASGQRQQDSMEGSQLKVETKSEYAYRYGCLAGIVTFGCCVALGMLSGSFDGGILFGAFSITWFICMLAPR
jgi:hypothetical protein